MMIKCFEQYLRQLQLQIRYILLVALGFEKFSINEEYSCHLWSVSHYIEV